MFDRFTDASKRVMNLARRESQRLDHECLAPEHILLGLVDVPDSFGAKVIQTLGRSLQQVRAEVENRAAPGAQRLTLGPRPFTAARSALPFSYSPLSKEFYLGLRPARAITP